jgi:tetrahydromethanopterin S-methyltransferase subunit A
VLLSSYTRTTHRLNRTHYSYDNRLLRVIEGKDARSVYWTIIENGWITQLSHAAYLGKELAKAEISIKSGLGYLQDAA